MNKSKLQIHQHSSKEPEYLNSASAQHSSQHELSGGHAGIQMKRIKVSSAKEPDSLYFINTLGLF
jgi:hypothetical protein